MYDDYDFYTNGVDDAEMWRIEQEAREANRIMDGYDFDPYAEDDEDDEYEFDELDE